MCPCFCTNMKGFDQFCLLSMYMSTFLRPDYKVSNFKVGDFIAVQGQISTSYSYDTDGLPEDELLTTLWLGRVEMLAPKEDVYVHKNN